MKKLYNRLTIVLLLMFVVLFSGCSSMSDMVSDSHNPGMTKILYQVDIKASKTDVWKVLAEFDNLRWSAGVTDVHYLNQTRAGVGMARHCDLIDNGYIVERITEWNEGSGFTYAIDDSSDPISNNSYVIWRINGDEHQSQVAFEVHYELQYGVIGDMMNSMFAKRKFSAQITEFMGELKNHVEQQALVARAIEKPVKG